MMKLAEDRGLRDRFIFVAGGPRLSHPISIECGFDAGFGPGTLPSQVASYIVDEYLRRHGGKKMSKGNPQKTLSTLLKSNAIVGREAEAALLLHCLFAGKNILLEGPVGVGKTHLLQSVSDHIGRKVVRIDGDARYTEQKLTGWFDPPSVLKKGYSSESYFDGPLAEAMRSGAILFINELNRMPEGVQNVLLPALDEKQIVLPRVGTLKAKEGFCVVATQNPQEFVATSHLSEAILDRFELITLSYQSESEEWGILQKNSPAAAKNAELGHGCLQLVRATRSSPLFKRGASVRAAISIFDIALSLGGDNQALEQAVAIALPTRVELSEEGFELGMKKALEKTLEDLKKKAPAAK